LHDGAEKYMPRVRAERDRRINFQYLYFCAVYFSYYFAFSGGFFFKPLTMLFCCYFYFIAYFLNQYPSTYGRRFMDREAGLLSSGLALQAETCA